MQAEVDVRGALQGRANGMKTDPETHHQYLHSMSWTSAAKRPEATHVRYSLIPYATRPDASQCAAEYLLLLKWLHRLDELVWAL